MVARPLESMSMALRRSFFVKRKTVEPSATGLAHPWGLGMPMQAEPEMARKTASNPARAERGRFTWGIVRCAGAKG